MRKFLITLFVVLGLAIWVKTPLAAAQPMQDACASFDRPNIDCACVGSRIATFNRVSPNSTAKAVIDQGYLHALGLNNTYPESLQSMMSDPMTAIMIVEAYDGLGGRPENIADYEQGCVIAGAPKPEIELLSTAPSVISYISACTESVGDDRYCQCDAARKSSHVSHKEFEAYFRSFSDYRDEDATSSAELSEMRGQAMGISGKAFDQLQANARAKMQPHAETDEAYCAALTWADERSGVDSETRLDAGFEPGAAAVLDDTIQPIAPADEGPLDTARRIVSDACSMDGNSDQYCSCYQDEFETRVIAAAPSSNVALAWALMGTSGSALSATEQLRLTQSVPQADHQAAGMMFIETMDMGENCTQGVSTATALSGTPYERMIHICVAENEDEILCNCMIGQMQSKLSEDDFELIADIREADFLGADDPLAVVAEDRGLTSAEAEEALAMNTAMMNSMMGMNLMSCFGDLPPGMPMSFPGMPAE
ncbi:MAG: hypothetical protein AAFO74_16045 [Pseudomonadota bacterium]